MSTASNNVKVSSPFCGSQLSSIKDILEKVNLFNIPDVEEKGKDAEIVLDPTSAYLGPKLWENPIDLEALQGDSNDMEFSVMNVDEFMLENNLQLDPNLDEISSMDESGSPSSMKSIKLEKEPRRPRVVLPKGENDFLYTESKRARMEREAEERRQQLEGIDIVFDEKDLSLATVPGTDFNPRERVYVKPQPIIRKRKKDYVPDEKKDDMYWEKRQKNNISARRSREAKRLKENQVALRMSYLEKENTKIKFEMDDLKEENQNLKDTISFLRNKLREYEKN